MDLHGRHGYTFLASFDSSVLFLRLHNGLVMNLLPENIGTLPECIIWDHLCARKALRKLYRFQIPRGLS